MFQHTDKQIEKIHQLLTDGRRDVPNFYDEEDIEVIYVPVEGGYLRVFHHLPKKNIDTKDCVNITILKLVKKNPAG